ncbi:MAG: hypothetical protein K2L74_08715 [Muribaculaceae bacterium]|nr:hypothetical protein [Muribaculaceae bacterium]
MIDDENDSRRNEIVERFRESLKKPVSERYFDEDELVDIFDFAGDMSDDYIKMEVLLCGARLYPDSALLKERRAIFYSFLGGEAVSNYLDDNEAENAPLWEIMRLRARAPQGKDAERALKYLLDGVERLDDEAVIQLVELASQLGVYDWLVANEKLLRGKAEYAPILIYELAVVSELNHEYDNAVRYLEELTEAEPFNAYYWYMLAQDFELLDKRDRAMAALDYSLAIDPDGKEALQMRARMLLGGEDTAEEGAEIVRRLAEKYPDDPEVQRVSAYVAFATGNLAESRERIRNCLERFPGDRAVLSNALATGIGDMVDILDRFYDATDERDENTWLDWAEDLMEIGALSEARMVIETYMRKSATPPEDWSVYVDVLFQQGDFTRLNELLDEHAGDEYPIYDGSPSMMLMCLIARLKAGRIADVAKTVADLHAYGYGTIATTSDRLSYICAEAVVREIEARLKSNKNADWSEYDPLGLWSGLRDRED